MTTPTPSTTPPTTKIQAPIVTSTDPSPTIMQRLSELEKKVEALSKIDHSEAIEESVQANVINKVKNQLPNFLPKAVFDFVNPRIESTVCEVLQKTPAFLAQSSSTPNQSSSKAAESLSEYELNKILFDKIDRSRSYMTHDKHQELYDALLNLMCLDDAIASGEVNPDKVLRKRHCDEDQDPPSSSDKEKKRSGKGKRQKESVEEPVHEAAIDVEEPIRDDVVNDVDQPQDDVDPKKDNSTCKLEKDYTTSITKTKAAKYELEFIEDMILELWSLVKVAYDKNAELGISY
ncbi:hypothetical protein Tco_0158945 [Tanacetum coccineum]